MARKQYSRRAVAGLVASAFAVPALPASAIGLLDAYQAALQNDPTYRSAVHDREAGQQSVNLGRSNLLPNVSLQYMTSHNSGYVTAPNFLGQVSTSPTRYDSESGSINLRQPIVNFDGIARYRQGVAQVSYTDAQFTSRQQDLILRLMSAYSDAQFAEYQVALARAQRDTYAEQMRVNERMFEKGEGTRTDMLETQAKLDLAEAQLIEAQDNLTVMRNSLAVIVGRDITELDPMAEDFRIQPMKPASFDEWKAIALAHNPDIAAQQYAVDAAQQEVNKNRAGHLPRIDFVASVSRGKSETISTLNQDLSVRSVGFQLTMPIFSGGATEASTVQAVAGKEKAKSDLEAKTSQVMVDLRKQYSQAVSSMTRVDALVKSVKSASLLVDATRQSIKGGERINLDLLNAQQQLFAAKRDLAQARYTYLVAYLRLRADAGTLSEDDLRTVASYFRHGGSVEAGGGSVAAAGQASAQSAQETSVVLRKNAPEVRLVGQKPGQILVGKESGGG